MAGYSVPGRNGQGRDLVKGCARTAQSLEDRNEEPESSEAEGNQVSAPCSPCGRGGRCVVGAAAAFLGVGPSQRLAGPGVRSADGLTDKRYKAHTQKLGAVRVTSTPLGPFSG